MSTRFEGKQIVLATDLAASTIATVPLLPVAHAPVRGGQEFGPCILDVGECWLMGYWNGEGWYAYDGDPVAPYRYGLMPAPTQKS